MVPKWIAFLPAFAQNMLSGRHELQAALANTWWLSLDRLLRIAVGAVLTVWLARYLGPEGYGQLSYAIGFALILGPVASLGLPSILVRELVTHPGKSNQLMVSAFILRFLGGSFAYILAMISVHFLRPGDTFTYALVGVTAAAVLFQSSEVVDLWFQSRVRSRNPVLCKTIVFVLVSGIKLWLILVRADLMAFAWLFLAEFAASTLALTLLFRVSYGPLSITHNWRVSARRLLQDSLPMMIANTAIMISMRLDIIMVRELSGVSGAGIYAAATVISDASSFLPVVIVASAFPAILKYRLTDQSAYRSSILKLYRTLFCLAIAIVLPLFLISGIIIGLLYGPHYQQSHAVLAIHLWTCIPLFLSVATTHYLLGESLLKPLLFRALLGAAANITLNFFLIPRFGPRGAATAALCSQLLIFFSLLFFRDTRNHFALILHAVGIGRGTGQWS